MKDSYKLILFVNVFEDGELNHADLVDYDFNRAPFVPRVGDFIRVRDPEIHRQHKKIHIAPGYQDVAGWVTDVVTTFYGGDRNQTVIGVYINPRQHDEALKQYQTDKRKP